MATFTRPPLRWLLIVIAALVLALLYYAWGELTRTRGAQRVTFHKAATFAKGAGNERPATSTFKPPIDSPSNNRRRGLPTVASIFGKRAGPDHPSLYLSNGLYDAYGNFEGTERLAQRAVRRGIQTEWHPLYGGHCAIDIASLSAFLAS